MYVRQALTSEKSFLREEHLAGHQKIAGSIHVWGSEIVSLR